MNRLELLLNIILDGQAFLHAQHKQLVAELYGKSPTEEELLAWEDEWKEQTLALLEEGLGSDDEQACILPVL